jgi:hypothetical protein
MDHVLAGSTADLDDVARPPGEVLFERSPERLVITMESRGIKATIRLDPAAFPAKFNEIFSQFVSPENEKQSKTQARAKRPNQSPVKSGFMNDLSHQLQCGRY